MSDGCRRLCPTPAGSGSRGKSITSENFWQKISVKAMRIWTGAASSPGIQDKAVPVFLSLVGRAGLRTDAGARRMAFVLYLFHFRAGIP